MKPRLKILPGRRLQVLRPASSTLPVHRAEAAAKRAVVAHYGTLQQFAQVWGFKYTLVTSCFNSHAATRAGEMHQLRLVLGLPTQPTDISKKLVAAQQRLRLRREPEWIFGQPEGRA